MFLLKEIAEFVPDFGVIERTAGSLREYGKVKNVPERLLNKEIKHINYSTWTIYV